MPDAFEKLFMKRPTRFLGASRFFPDFFIFLFCFPRRDARARATLADKNIETYPVRVFRSGC